MNYLLKSKKVITGKRGEVFHNGAILVEGNKIVKAGTQHDVGTQFENKMEVIDFGDSTLMPGMIDCHVHLGFDGSSDPVAHMKASDDNQLLITMLYNARLLLKSGVTTARELGARNFLDLVVKESIEAGTAYGPNLLVSNRPLTTTGGHCWFMGCECDDQTEIKKAVRGHVKAGADLIKIMLTGGFMTKGSAPWYNQFNLDEMKTAAYEAHRLDKMISVHAHGTVGIQYAVEADVDTIEHCSWVSSASSFTYDHETSEKIVDKGIYVCLTTNVNWKNFATAERYDRIRQMKKLGMKFIAGTDAGINNTPHDQYVGGLEALKEIGMTNEEIIESATVLAAEGCGIEKITGSISPEKRADIIVVKGDPLQDLSALWNVEWVMRNGKVPDLAFV
jgi:imidazolonepropionase-like amidohydrolase